MTRQFALGTRTSPATPRLAGALGVSFGASVAILLLNVVTGVILARSLGPHDRGELAVVILWPTALAALGGIGLADATTYHAARRLIPSGSLAGTALALALAQGLAVVAVGIGVLPLVMHHYDATTLRTAFAFLAYAPVSMVALAAMSVLNGRRRFTTFQTLRLLTFALITAPVVALAATGSLNVRRAVATYLVANVVIALIAIVLVCIECDEPLAVDRKTLRSLLSFGIRSHAGSVSSLLNERLDQLLVSAFLAPIQLGLYVVAVTITSATSLFGGAVAPVASVQVAHLGVTKASATARNLVSLATWTSLSITLPMVVFARPLIGVFFGHEFESVTRVAQLLLVAAVFLSTNRALTATLNGLGRPLDAAIAEAAAVGCTLVLLATLLPTIGLVGAGIASLVAYGCSTLWMAFRTATTLRIPVHHLFVPASRDRFYARWVSRPASGAAS
ncbi:MAG: oligosaccharide flippase family protein [Gaiellaceae bacterium]